MRSVRPMGRWPCTCDHPAHRACTGQSPSPSVKDCRSCLVLPFSLILWHCFSFGRGGGVDQPCPPVPLLTDSLRWSHETALCEGARNGWERDGDGWAPHVPVSHAHDAPAPGPRRRSTSCQRPCSSFNSARTSWLQSRSRTSAPRSLWMTPTSSPSAPGRRTTWPQIYFAAATSKAGPPGAGPSTSGKPSSFPKCPPFVMDPVQSATSLHGPLRTQPSITLHGTLHGGRLPVRPDPNPAPPLWTPQPIIVSPWPELASWAPTAPGNFLFEPGKFATRLISPHLFTFKMLTMS